MDYKSVIGTIGIILTFVGYAPYVRDVLKRKTTPHLFTWLIWSLAAGISAALQIFGGAGAGAWSTVAVTFISVYILFLSFRQGNRDFTYLDMSCLVLALLSLFLWVVVKQPVWSAFLIVTADILGFIPTMRKSWAKPYSETLSAYWMAGVRHALSITALRQFNILTMLYPVVLVIANTVSIFILTTRRKAIPEHHA